MHTTISQQERLIPEASNPAGASTGSNAAPHQRIDLEEFLRICGCERHELPQECRDKFEALNTGYRLPTPEERDQFILAAVQNLQTQSLRRTPEQNLEAFEKGWDENLRQCVTQGVSISALTPRYVKPLPVMRYAHRYIVPDNPYLFSDLFDIAMICMFRRYLAQHETIYEFGCGTGRYLAMLSDLYPEKHLVGLDWTESSVKILQLLGEQEGRKVTGIRFDMLEPPEVRLTPNSGVFTVGALEQLGDRHGKFLAYLLANRPALVVHYEPIAELYAEDDLVDYLALAYHRHRGYLAGYLTALRELQAQGRVEILEARPPFIGDARHDGTAFLAWRPTGVGDA